MDDFDEIYDGWVDAVNSRPLTSSRLDEVSDVIDINTQIINRIYSIRRYLEISESDNIRYHPYRRTTNIFNSTLINNLFGILLEGTNLDTNLDTNYDTNYDDIKVTLTKEQFEVKYIALLTIWFIGLSLASVMSVRSLSTSPSTMVPQCPWVVYSQLQTSATISMSSIFSLMALIAFCTIPLC